MNALTGPEFEDTLPVRLGALLADPRLPERARLVGARLLKRATAPVRLLLTGHDGAGKTTLANMLIGEALLPTDQPLPPVSLSYASTTTCALRLKSGEVERLDEPDFGQIRTRKPVFVELGLPNRDLAGISILDVTLPRGAQAGPAALAWASARSDMVVWCGQSFGRAERELWAAMPEQLRDHAFFALCKADELAARQILKDVLSTLAPLLPSELQGIYAVAGRQGLAARIGPDGEHSPAWLRSGGKTLLKALRQHADRGRQEDRDKATHFAEQYGVFAHTRLREKPEDESAKPDKLDAPGRDALGASLATLRSLADTYSGNSDAAPVIEAPELLEACLQTASALEHSLSEGGPGLRALRDDVEQAIEMITLYQLEANEDAAADAISLVAQLHDELILADAA